MAQEKPKFDPSKGFQEVKPKFDPSKPFSEDGVPVKFSENSEPIKGETSLLQDSLAGLKSFSNAALMGTAPYIGAGIESGLEAVGVLPDTDFKSKVQAYKDILKKEQEESPISTTIGSVAGALAGGSAAAKGLGALPGIGKIYKAAPGAGALTRYGQAGLGAGTLAALETPETGFLDYEERLKNALIAAPLGVAGQGITEGVGKFAKAVSDIPKKLQRGVQIDVLKQAGTSAKEFAEMEGKGLTDKVVNLARKEKLVGAGKDAGDVYEKSSVFLESVGKKIGAIYDKYGPKILSDANISAKLSPQKIADDLIDVTSRVKPKVGQGAFDTKMQSMIEDVMSGGENLKDIRYLNKIISDLDDLIDQSKKVSDLSSVQQGFKAARTYLRDLINTSVDDAAKLMDDSAGKQLKDLNEKYFLGSRLNSSSMRKMSRESMNRYLGLSEQIGSGAGFLGGLLSGEGDINERLKRAITYGTIGGIGSYGARRFGPGVTQSLSDILSKGLGAASAPPKAVQSLAEMLSSNPSALGAGSYLIKKELENKE